MRSDARKRIAEESAYEAEFHRYAEASGQVLCPHPSPILNIPCDGCRATL